MLSIILWGDADYLHRLKSFVKHCIPAMILPRETTKKEYIKVRGACKRLLVISTSEWDTVMFLGFFFNVMNHKSFLYFANTHKTYPNILNPDWNSGWSCTQSTQQDPRYRYPTFHKQLLKGIPVLCSLILVNNPRFLCKFLTETCVAKGKST